MAHTIAAVATAKANAGISVIRISGDNAVEIAGKVFRCADGSDLNDTKGYRAKFGKILLDGEPCDDAVTLVFRAPKSYTGENVCELSIHGGLYMTERTLKELFKNGAKPAEAGEFTKRAFLNGKIDLAQAESVASMISASSAEQARLSYSVLNGRLSKKIEGVCNSLIECSALMAAWVDYPDEEIPELETENLIETLKSAKENLSSLLSKYDSARVISEGADTVICGKPNAGKSSLMNLLTGTEKSIVTDIKGTTRDIVEDSVVFAGTVLHLYDTAGIHESDDRVESIGIERAVQKINEARLIFAVFDCTEELGEDDFELIEKLKGKDAIAIINKTDLDILADEEIIKNNFNHTVKISAKNGEGIEELEKCVKEILKTDNFDSASENLINERQKINCQNAFDYISQALDDAVSGMTFDAVNVMIDSAIDELMSLTGKKATTEVVNNIFSRFCVGK